jgi:hypothetical protein
MIKKEHNGTSPRSTGGAFLLTRHKIAAAFLLILVVICQLAFVINLLQALGTTSNSTLTPPSAPKVERQQQEEKEEEEQIDDFKLAHDQSFGFFNDIPSSYWKRYQQIVSEYKKHKNPDNPILSFRRSRKIQLFYQDNYEPNFSCAFERRVGQLGDGGKWICDPHRLKERMEGEQKNNDSSSSSKCLVYSIGSNNDFSFETDFQQRFGGNGDLCELHIFDFGDYESNMPKGLNMHYHQFGLGDGDGLHTLAETIKLLGHEDRAGIDVFKIDCEWCEWDLIGDFIDPSIPKIKQLLVETHGVPEKKILPFFDGLLDNGYVMFHKEANIIDTGRCVEFGFLKLDKSFFLDVKKIKRGGDVEDEESDE